jgi:hypothetical protein
VPKALVRLKALLQKGLTETVSLWPDVRVAYRWVHRVTQILNNEAQLDGSTVKRRVQGLLGAMGQHRATAGTLAPALTHFLKVTRSYWPGLFHCYDVPDLPRTNNALEHYFGAHRYHERRATGRKGASPALVLSGSVRLIAAAATRLRLFSARDLAPENPGAWHALRHELTTRRQQHTRRRRFRRDPTSYLAGLEADFLQLTLPP